MLFGNCQCERIKYEVSADPTKATACHCLECRQAFKAPYGPWYHVTNDSVTWSMKPDLVEKSDIAERSYCSKCYTPLTMQYFFQPQKVSLSADTTTVSLPIMEHIFLEEQDKDYVLPDDGAPRYQKFDPPFERKLQEGRESTSSKNQ